MSKTLGCFSTSTCSCGRRVGRSIQHAACIYIVLITGWAVADIVVTGKLGQSVELECSTAPGTSVSWQYHMEPAGTDEYICIDGTVVLSFREKYSLVQTSPGYFKLTINNLGSNDTGIYTCIEDGGIGDRNLVELQVATTGELSPSPPPANDCPDCTSSAPVIALAVAILVIVAITLISFIVYIVYTQISNRAHTKKRLSEEEKPFIRKVQDNFDQTLSRRVTESEDHTVEGSDIVQKKVVTCTINKDTWVSGVTIVDGILYMLRGKLLHKYDHKTHSRQDSISIEQLKRHYRNDLASCRGHKCLYISDYSNKCIIKVELPQTEDGNIECKKWVDTNNCSPSGLSVTGSHTLIVTSFDACKLLEYDFDGTLKQEIKLKSDLEWPMHAIQLGITGDFVVCHGGDGLWLVDIQGNIKVTYQSEQNQLAWPCHMAVDKDNTIYVADHYNDRILKLNSQLRDVREVVPRGQFHRPRRLYLDVDSRRLYVGQSSGKLTFIDLDNP